MDNLHVQPAASFSLSWPHLEIVDRFSQHGRDQGEESKERRCLEATHHLNPIYLSDIVRGRIRVASVSEGRTAAIPLRKLTRFNS